jgi:hypothetical protein
MKAFTAAFKGYKARFQALYPIDRRKGRLCLQAPGLVGGSAVDQ